MYIHIHNLCSTQNDCAPTSIALLHVAMPLQEWKLIKLFHEEPKDENITSKFTPYAHVSFIEIPGTHFDTQTLNPYKDPNGRDDNDFVNYNLLKGKLEQMSVEAILLHDQGLICVTNGSV